MVNYELRVEGKMYAGYDDLNGALKAVRHLVAREPDLDPEIIDLRTGRACMVAASRRWRDEIAAVIGG
jgi:hypothetical protein